ncbi:insulinase family protein [Vibrio sp. MA40-2]|uniref:M16 family metallopeptidase n=1 Tax=Vibrio sp. MA40-2 TaxID=3391828 RepID=UPI0039A54E2F
MKIKYIRNAVLRNAVLSVACIAVSFASLAATYTHGELANGLKYHIFSTDVEEDYLDIHLLINVGGADELPHEYGSAHMLEHTLFHKSQHFPKGISTELEQVGWKLGDQLNAYTGYEQTKFVMTPPLGVKEIDTALLAMKDIVAAPKLTEEDWAREQQIVLAERRNNLGLRGRMAEERRQMLYRNSKQAQSTLIGTEQDILGRKVETLREFHDRWYQPSNAQIALIGDIDPELVIAKLKQSLGSIDGKPVPERDNYYYEPHLHDGWKISEIRDPQSKNNQVSLVFRVNDGYDRAYDSYEGIRNQQIDRSARTMIMERLDALNLSLPKGVDPLFIQRTEIGHHTAAISLFAGTTAGKLQLGLEQLFELRQQLLNYPITKKELNFYRDDMDAYIKANIGEEQLPDQIEDLTRLALGALRERPVAPVGEKVKLYKKVMADITTADVNKRIQEWMTAVDRSAMFQIEASVDYSVPTEKQLVGLAIAYSKKQIPAPNDIEELVGGEFTFKIKPGTITSKHTDRHYDKVHEWMLSNGDKFVWLKSDVAKDDVFFRSVSNVGYLAQNFEGWKARLASQFVWMSAPEGYDMQTLGTWRRRNSIIFRNLLASESYQINGEAGSENIEKIFEAYAAYQLTPKIDDDFMTMQLAGIRQSLLNQEETGKLVREAEEELRYKVSHLTVPDIDQLDSLSKNELLNLWTQIVRTPVTHFLVGDVSEKQLEVLVKQYLANIPRNPSQHSFHKEQLASGEKETKINVENTERTDINAWTWKVQPWSIATLQQLQAARSLARNALKEALRGKEKGVYTVDFESSINMLTNQLVSHLHFNTKPENSVKLWKVSQETLKSLPERLTQEELDAEKKHLLKAEDRALMQPRVWLGRLERSYQYYGDARVLSEMRNMDANVNLIDVKKMANRVWTQDNLRYLWVSPQQY